LTQALAGIGLPLQRRPLAAVPGLDHDLLARLKPDPVACPEHMVAGVAAAGQPDAAADDREFAARRTDAQRLFEGQLEGPAMKQFELRFHHQSPIRRRPKISSARPYDPASSGADPMKSRQRIDAVSE
jgi:hypothetical protein